MKRCYSQILLRLKLTTFSHIALVPKISQSSYKWIIDIAQWNIHIPTDLIVNHISPGCKNPRNINSNSVGFLSTLHKPPCFANGRCNHLHLRSLLPSHGPTISHTHRCRRLRRCRDAEGLCVFHIFIFPQGDTPAKTGGWLRNTSSTQRNDMKWSRCFFEKWKTDKTW